MEKLRLALGSVSPAPGMPTAVIGIDGPGGSGKSTLARRIAGELGGAPIIPTDDFASWEEPIDWWPRLLKQVLAPLRAGGTARYQRYDWGQKRLAEWIEVPTRPITIIEGVTAIRSEFDEYLAFRIWVETPRDLRLQRGLERDGEAMLPQWEAWMREEDAYIASDRPRDRANFFISGEGQGGVRSTGSFLP